MSTFSHLFDLPEQICYVQCGFCTTILLVSVPCSNMSMVVTVRCGHCTSLLSVNMMKASFVPLHLFASLNNHHAVQDKGEDYVEQVVDAAKARERQHSPLMPCSSDDNEQVDEQDDEKFPLVNKPPEKRQRAPSAYNRFIKEEITRLKANNPCMSHKEAFSTAAKNWAHFPPTQYTTEEEEEEDEIYEQRTVPTWIFDVPSGVTSNVYY